MQPRTEIIKRQHDLSNVIYEMHIGKNVISELTMKKILNPMQKMDWEERDNYAEKLLIILKTSQTEKEILEKAEKIEVLLF